MVDYSYKVGSGVIDYSADADTKIDVQNAIAMALVDIAAELKRLNGEAAGVQRVLENISDAADSIRQSMG